MRGYRAPADAAFLWIRYMQSPRMTGNATTHKESPQPHCIYVLGNTESIGCMGLYNTILNASMLRNVTIGQVNVPELFLCSFIDCPTHNVHHGCITQGTTTLDFQLELTTMVSLVAGLAKRYEITWGITTSLTALQVVNIQNRVFVFL